MARRHLLAVLLLILGVLQPGCAKDAGANLGKKTLKRSDAKRWENFHEVVRAEIKSATRHFLEERSRDLVLPIEVDILLVGFDGDGGYGYRVDRQALAELLGSATEDNTICPTVWETGESAAVCFSVNYLTLDSSKLNKATERVENALKHNMEWVGDRSQDWPDGSKEVQVYEVDANGELEATIWDILDEAYGGAHPEVNRNQHSQIVIINPSKLRMKSALPPPPHASSHADAQAHAAPTHEANLAAAGIDFITEWKKGTINSSHVVEQEAGYVYRYRYGGRGAAAAFVGQYNFLVIDVAAGPVSYGPLASPAGAVAPSGMPRIMPMLLRMTRELEENPQPGTFRAHLLGEAAAGQGAVFVGQLASTLAAATRHLFASDMLLTAAESLAGGPDGRQAPKRVVVPIVVLQDHMRELEGEGDGSRWVDVEMVQLALDELLPPDVYGAVSVSRHMIGQHKALAAALVKARHSRSDAVLAEPPDVGLHRSQTVSLDSATLLRELRLAAADDSLVGGLVDHMSGDYAARLPYMDNQEEFLDKKRHDTKVLPVFIFSMERTPDQMMFDNRQLVAAGNDVVAVLQLLGSPSVDEAARGRVYSGHMAEGHHLLLDAGESPTRAVVAGLAAAVGGLVPAHQRYCAAERAVVEDWRWSVGAVPWGPYSNYTALSSIFASTSRRNLLVSRIERPLRRLAAAMDRIDHFIAAHLQGPFAFLKAGRGSSADAPLSALTADLGEAMPAHHLLDDLARQHVLYNNATRRRALGASKPKPANASASPAPSPSPAPLPTPEGQAAKDAGDAYAHYEGGRHHNDGSDGGEGGWTHGGGAGHSPEGAGAGGEGAGAAPAVDADLVVEQHVLSPNIAARLQAALEAIGTQLEQISFHLYSRDWAELEDELPSFVAAVEAFAASADRDLRHAAEVLACCQLAHVPRGAGGWFVAGVLVAALGSFAVLAFVAIRGQKVYHPPPPRPSRHSSNMGRNRSMSGSSLPTWASGGQGSSGNLMLPR